MIALECFKMWKIVDNYFKTHDIAQHHINSYNSFIKKGIKEIVSANDRITSEVDPNWYVHFYYKSDVF